MSDGEAERENEREWEREEEGRETERERGEKGSVVVRQQLEIAVQ